MVTPLASSQLPTTAVVQESGRTARSRPMLVSLSQLLPLLSSLLLLLLSSLLLLLLSALLLLLLLLKPF